MHPRGMTFTELISTPEAPPGPQSEFLQLILWIPGLEFISTPHPILLGYNVLTGTQLLSLVGN